MVAFGLNEEVAIQQVMSAPDVDNESQGQGRLTPMAKIRVEIDGIPDGEKCYGDDFFCKYEGTDYCHIFRYHKDGGSKLPQCIAATVQDVRSARGADEAKRLK